MLYTMYTEVSYTHYRVKLPSLHQRLKNTGIKWNKLVTVVATKNVFFKFVPDQ